VCSVVLACAHGLVLGVIGLVLGWFRFSALYGWFHIWQTIPLTFAAAAGLLSAMTSAATGRRGEWFFWLAGATGCAAPLLWWFALPYWPTEYRDNIGLGWSLPVCWASWLLFALAIVTMLIHWIWGRASRPGEDRVARDRR